ncbi:MULTISPECIES: hypothetical protein [unclassified Microcoleus]|uniref:hypothetical protein n=1 Tax=unclassified Microcoleus TaxID=2642155 RepID=UPI002FCF1817
MTTSAADEEMLKFDALSARCYREHLTFAAKLEIGVLRQEAGGRRQKERGRRKEPQEGRSQKKYFYKYEMLPVLHH